MAKGQPARHGPFPSGLDSQGQADLPTGSQRQQAGLLLVTLPWFPQEDPEAHQLIYLQGHSDTVPSLSLLSEPTKRAGLM